MIENHRGQRIETLADWQTLAPPTSPVHWREYRSAYELAHAWTRGDGRQRLLDLLATRAGFGGPRVERAIGERKSWFDDIPSGPRNHDLLAHVSTRTGHLVVGLEAKADEPFDRDLADYVASARRRNPNTRAPERLDRLTRALFGTTLNEDPTLAPLRYQLFAALAGTLAEAAPYQAMAVALVVHEFVTPETDPLKRARNADDLEAFLARFGAAQRTMTAAGDWLVGPVTVPGNAHLPGDVPIYIGKLVTHVERRVAADPSRAGSDPGPASPLGRPPSPGPPVQLGRRPPRATFRAPERQAAHDASALFRQWTREWTALAEYRGRLVPDVEARIASLLELWRKPLPDVDWRRERDARLLDPQRRYTRGNGGIGEVRPGEHAIEYEILAPLPVETVTHCLGERLVDGVNAVPLSRDPGGGRSGNVEADMLLLTADGHEHRLVLAEVKAQSQTAWYAAVANLRQLKLLTASPASRRVFHIRLPELELPEALPVTAIVLAPKDFYAAPGAQSAAVAPTEELLGRFRDEIGVDASLATWDPDGRVIERL